MHDLSQEFDDNNYAVYLPAISGFYTSCLTNATTDITKIRQAGAPASLEYGFEGLDFLKDEDNYFRYRYGLFSAGHAQLDLAKCDKEEAMVQQRPDDAFILGDSGGFQIATGIIKLDWKNAKDPQDPKRTALCEKILRYLEHTSDYAMTLDVPAHASSPPLNKRTGLNSFSDTLEVSLLNLDYFSRNRNVKDSKTKFLNVLSATNRGNAKEWYESVSKYSNPDWLEEQGIPREHAFEGYAFGGECAVNLLASLDNVLRLIDDGLIERAEWFHFLGIGRLEYACYYTAMQQALNRQFAPKLQISFDAASPFVSTAYGKYYGVNTYTKNRMGYNLVNAPDNKDLAFETTPPPFSSPIMDRICLKDLCVKRPAHGYVNGERVVAKLSKSKDKKKWAEENEIFTAQLEDDLTDLKAAGLDVEFIDADLNKLGKETRTSWDMGSYLLYMAHNVYMHIDGVREANRLMKVETARIGNTVTWRDWHPGTGKKAVTNTLSDIIPSDIIYFKSLMDELFNPELTSEQRWTMFKEAEPFIKSLNFKATRTNSVFDAMFETNDDDVEADDDKFADMNDEKIVALEKGGAKDL